MSSPISQKNQKRHARRCRLRHEKSEINKDKDKIETLRIRCLEELEMNGEILIKKYELVEKRIEEIEAKLATMRSLRNDILDDITKTSCSSLCFLDKKWINDNSDSMIHYFTNNPGYDHILAK